MPGLCAGIGAEQEDFCAARAGRGDHAFAEAELHLPRREIRHDDDQPPDELRGLVGALDAGENRCA